MAPVLHELNWPQRTERLTLRPALPQDAAAVFAFQGDPEVTRWTSRAYADLAEFEEVWPERRLNTLLIELDGRVAGTVMIRVTDAWAQREVAETAENAQAELGWTIAPWAQGRGIATEAVRASLAIAFDGLGVRRIEANCFAANTASWRIMQKLSLRQEGYYVKESLHRSGEWLDGMSWALLAEEWRAGQATTPGERPHATPAT